MRYLINLSLLMTVVGALGQSTDMPLNGWIYPAVDRWDIQSGGSFHTSVKPLSRRFLKDLSASNDLTTSPGDAYDLNYLETDTWEYADSIPERKPILKYFFNHPPDFVSFRNKDLDLHFNPVVYFGLGSDTNADKFTYVNTRGVELRGTIDNKVSFYSLLTENQARYPDYVNQLIDSTLTIPYEGFWKRLSDGTGTDFLRARGYIDFNISKHISAQFGYGKHFIGNGRRSLVLSDFANNYPYLKLNTQIWKIQYTNIYAQMIGEVKGGSNFGLLGVGSFTKKYFTFHRLGMNVTRNLELGLFESVVYGRPDSLGSNNLKLEYLNPIMFYRALEQQDGSADNVLIGLDFKYNLFKRIQLYGQLVIDELIVSEAFSDKGWWGNKNGTQLGIKYINAFEVKDLNLQFEFNRVRPYTYSHESLFTSYTHYMQPLAHPLGANFTEQLIALDFRPLPKWKVGSVLMLADYGSDIGAVSYGKDPTKSYNLRPDDYGIEQIQGDQQNMIMSQTSVTYQWLHNVLVDLTFIYRKETNQNNNIADPSSILAMSFRWNFPIRTYLF
ncbi:MAG: capsule assembly Wzi family protein [Bacteroidota bacterium]